MFRDAEWDARRTAKFIAEECGLPEYADAFEKNHVTGKLLGMLGKDDLDDLGVKKVGHRIKLMNKFKVFQAAHAAVRRLEGITSWTELVWPWQCCEFCYPRTFRLTQTGLRIKQDYCCGMGTENTIDLCLIRDVKFFTNCCYSSVQVISDDGSSTPNLVFHIWSHKKGKDIYKSLQQAMEANQDRRAGATKIGH